MDRFVWNELLKPFKQKASIGFFLDSRIPPNYDRALASIRCRCYDVIDELCRRGEKAEIYRPLRKYDVVIFTKTYSKRALHLAEKLKTKGVLVIADAYCDFWGDKSRADDIDVTVSLANLADAVVVCSGPQMELFQKFNRKCLCIPEGINHRMFDASKICTNKSPVTLVWCGYSTKASDLYSIKSVLSEVLESGLCELLIISEKNPNIDFFKYKFVTYNERTIAEDMCLGDVFIAPRLLTEEAKLQHSILRVTLPMAVGLPVVASPVPSYNDTPAIICHKEDEWIDSITALAKDEDYRDKMGQTCKDYATNAVSISVTTGKYLDLINSLLINVSD